MDSIDHEEIRFVRKLVSKLIYREKTRLTKHYSAMNGYRACNNLRFTFSWNIWTEGFFFFLSILTVLRTPLIRPAKSAAEGMRTPVSYCCLQITVLISRAIYLKISRFPRDAKGEIVILIFTNE